MNVKLLAMTICVATRRFELFGESRQQVSDPLRDSVCEPHSRTDLFPTVVSPWPCCWDGGRRLLGVLDKRAIGGCVLVIVFLLVWLVGRLFICLFVC